MSDDAVSMPPQPRWGEQALENAIRMIRWAMGHGDLSPDDMSRARAGLDALEG